MNLRESAGIPLICTMVERKSVNSVKLEMNPTTTPVGRALPVFLLPTDDERMIGRMGRMHGDKIVTTPAKNANAISNIMIVFY